MKPTLTVTIKSKYALPGDEPIQLVLPAAKPVASPELMHHLLDWLFQNFNAVDVGSGHLKDIISIRQSSMSSGDRVELVWTDGDRIDTQVWSCDFCGWTQLL